MNKSFNTNHTQPVNILLNPLTYVFENTNKGFLETLKSTKSFNPKIKYIYGENNLKGAAFVNQEYQIHVKETLLSYIWIICYSLVTMFKEGIEIPKKKKEFKGIVIENSENYKRALELLKYGLSLKKDFSRWDTDKLPYPSMDEDTSAHIQIVNGVFLHAANFILLHEFAHVYLGHIDLKIESRGTLKNIDEVAMEYEADEKAIDFYFQDNQGNENSLKSIPVICGLSAILFLKGNTLNRTHPNNELRLKAALDRMNPKSNESWGIALFALKVWQKTYKLKIEVPAKIENLKDYFYQYIDAITAENKKRNGG